MNEHTQVMSPRMQQTLQELQGIIVQHYPTATFAISRGEDDPKAVHLTAIVDLDDPDECWTWSSPGCWSYRLRNSYRCT
jgi:hypothetical protein